jgi:hypothetical protein
MSVDREGRTSFQKSRKTTGVVRMGVAQHDGVDRPDVYARTLEIVQKHRAAGSGVEQKALPIVGFNEEAETMLAPERG